MTYRQPDEERLEQALRERRAREEEELRTLADDRATIAAIKDPLFGLGLGGGSRGTLIALGAGVGLPVAFVALGMMTTSHSVRDAAAWFGLLSGSGCGLASVGISVRGLVARATTGASAFLGILFGLVLVPWSIFCAVLTALLGWRSD